MSDLFLNQSYGKLYEEVYDGKCEVFEFQSALGTVKHLFMKRKVPFEINRTTFYDLITPFTYGGPVIEDCLEEDKWELLNDFQNAFQEYCNDNNIIAEFVRFHPMAANSIDFLHCYELDYVEDAIGINISGHENPVADSFSAESIAKVLEAFKSGVEYEIYSGEDKVDDFIYFLTKVQKNAGRQSQRYFNGCKELMDKRLIFVEAKFDGEVIGMTMGFLSDNILTTHLILTDEIGDHVDAAYVMHYGLTVWSKSHKVELIHLAGSWANKSEDEKLAFNKQFAELPNYNYCIGRKIWNEKVYSELCNKANVEMYIDYFPAYRVGEQGERESII